MRNVNDGNQNNNTGMLSVSDGTMQVIENPICGRSQALDLCSLSPVALHDYNLSWYSKDK